MVVDDVWMNVSGFRKNAFSEAAKGKIMCGLLSRIQPGVCKIGQSLTEFIREC